MATVASTPRTNTITLASATAGPFQVGFRLFDPDTLEVYVNGEPSAAWTLTASFSDGFTDSATITFTDALEAGDVIQIDGALTPRREDDYLIGDPGLTRKLNIELARIWSSLSEVKRGVQTSVRGFTPLDPVSGVDADLLFAAAADAARAEAAAALLEAVALQRQTALTTVAGQADYSIAYDAGRSDHMLVWYNGKFLEAGVEYQLVRVGDVPTLRLIPAPDHAGQRIIYTVTQHLPYDPNLNRVEGFDSRAALVTHIATNGAVEGQHYLADGLAYLGQTGATAIPDLPGLVPAGDVTPEHMGPVDGVADDVQITAASNYVASLGGGEVHLAATAYIGVGRAVAQVNGVRYIGKGPAATSYTATAYDPATWPLGDNCALIGVAVDAGGFQTEAAGKGAIVRYSNKCVVRDVVARDGYTAFGPNGAASGSKFYNIRAENCESRGWQADHNCHNNIVFGLHVDTCANSVVRIAHNASGNQIFGVYGRAVSNVAIWIAQGAHDNLVSGVTLESPLVSTAPAFQFDSNSFRNTIENFNVSGHSRLVEFDGQATDGVFADVPEGNTMLNLVQNGAAIGVTSNPASGDRPTHYALNWSAAGGYDARSNTVKNVFCEAFYGLCQNISSAANGSTIADIRTNDIGAGGAMKAMYSATNRVYLSNVDGFPTSADISASIAIDSTGLKTAAIDHGLPWSPSAPDCTVRFIRNTAVSDFRYDTLHLAAVTSTTITVRAFVSTASTTGGAVANLNVRIDHRDDVTFPLSQVIV